MTSDIKYANERRSRRVYGADRGVVRRDWTRRTALGVSVAGRYHGRWRRLASAERWRTIATMR